MNRHMALGIIASCAFGLAAVVTLPAAAAVGAAPAAVRPSTVAAAPQPPVGQRAAIEATEVVRVADMVARTLATSQRIPAGEVVTLSDGRTRALSAAQLFVLLVRFLGDGYERGVTPEHTPVPPEVTGPLETSEGSTGLLPETVIPTADLLAQARPTADVAESTGNLPSAIWVEGLRLTPAQFMGGLATVLQHAAMYDAAPQQVVVGDYLPPLDWSALPSSRSAPPALAEEQPAPEAALPVQASSAVAPAPPQITVYVPAKPPLSGTQSLTIEYQGPPAFVRLSIDGKARAVSNMFHFTYLWDTRLEPDGDHTLRVAAVNDAEQTLDSLEAIIATTNGNTPLR